MHDLKDYLDTNQALFDESIKDMSDQIKLLDNNLGGLVGALWLDQFNESEFDLVKFATNGEVQRELTELITFNRN